MLSRVVYSGSGSQTDFPVPFPYIDKSHVKVFFGAIEKTGTWVNNSLLRFEPPPPIGVQITIRRITPSASPLVDFNDGVAIMADDLDMATRQSLFVAQEAMDEKEGILADAMLFTREARDSATAAQQSALFVQNGTSQVASSLATITAKANEAAASATAAAASASAAAQSSPSNFVTIGPQTLLNWQQYQIRTNISAPSTTGEGAFGTWGISISGSANTATYADNSGKLGGKGLGEFLLNTVGVWLPDAQGSGRFLFQSNGRTVFRAGGTSGYESGYHFEDAWAIRYAHLYKIDGTRGCLQLRGASPNQCGGAILYTDGNDVRYWETMAAMNRSEYVVNGVSAGTGAFETQLSVSNGGYLWARAYGWVHDYFARKADGVLASGSFNWTGTAVQTSGLNNVASIVRESAAVYIINFATPLPSDRYVIAASGGNCTAFIESSGGSVGGAIALKTATQVKVRTGASFGGWVDPQQTWLSFVIIGV